MIFQLELRLFVVRTLNKLRCKRLPLLVGQSPPTMAFIAAAPGNQGAWMVLVGRKRGAAFTNRSNRPGDDMTDVLRTDNDAYAWPAGRWMYWLLLAQLFLCEERTG